MELRLEDLLKDENVPYTGFLYDVETGRMRKYIGLPITAAIDATLGSVMIELNHNFRKRFEISQYDPVFAEACENGINVRYIAKYNDGRFRIDTLGFTVGSKPIDAELYEMIRNAYLAQNILPVSEDTEQTANSKIIEKFSHAIHIPGGVLSPAQLKYLGYDRTYHHRSKENELIWLNDNEDFIDVCGCISSFSTSRDICPIIEDFARTHNLVDGYFYDWITIMRGLKTYLPHEQLHYRGLRLEHIQQDELKILAEQLENIRNEDRQKLAELIKPYCERHHIQFTINGEYYFSFSHGGKHLRGCSLGYTITL